jgi:hypothetical protein
MRALFPIQPVAGIPVQFPRMLILQQRIRRLAAVGKWLIPMAAAGLLFCRWALFETAGGQSPSVCAGYALVSLMSFLVSVCAFLDARSRVQDYKRAKDLFFENRSQQTRIARLFIHSKCQREAALVAARDLGMEAQVGATYAAMGYRWYHILPDAALRRPGLFLTWAYWRKTLFAPAYCSPHFYW